MAVYDDQGRFIVAPIVKTPKKKGGKGPRQSGNRAERIVANYYGAERTIGSGAYKHTNHNLTGDAEIYDNSGRPFIKMEIKASGVISASGEKSYTLKKPELDQMVREAKEAGELGMFHVHFKGQSVKDGYTLWSAEDALELIRLAKLGKEMEK